MEQGNSPSWSWGQFRSRPVVVDLLGLPPLMGYAGLGAVLTLFTFFGPSWAAQLSVWICVFLTLEAFGALLHKTEHKATWGLAMVVGLAIPIWVSVAIQFGSQAHGLINFVIMLADLAAILALASVSRRTFSETLIATMPVLIMALAIIMAIIIEGANPDAYSTIKFLHLLCLLLIGLTAVDATLRTSSVGLVSLTLTLALTLVWLATAAQVLPSAAYLVDQLSWDTSSGRVVTILWLCLLMISATAHKDAINLREFKLPAGTYTQTGTPTVGSVEMAIGILPFIAIMGQFELSALSHRILAIGAIISAFLFIRRFRVLQVRAMETSDQLRIALATDPLTGALNRSGLAGHWNEDHNGATVAFIDLDQFKPINDRYGHVVGDQVLQELSKRILTSIRAQDVACRWGGDEFLVVGPSMDLADADAFCERIRDAIRRPLMINNDLILNMDASIGFALVEPGVDFVTATEQADRMMYQKKQNKQGGLSRSSRPRPTPVRET